MNIFLNVKKLIIELLKEYNYILTKYFKSVKMAFMQQQLQSLASSISERRRCVCNPSSVGYSTIMNRFNKNGSMTEKSSSGKPVVSFMHNGSNHAAVFFNHSCTFRTTELWRKPL